VFCIQIKHTMAICPFILRNVSGRSVQYPPLYEHTSHFSYKFRLKGSWFHFGLHQFIKWSVWHVYSTKCNNNQDRSEQHLLSITTVSNVMAMLWHWHLLDSLCLQRTGFYPRPVHAGFVVDKLAPGQVSEYFGFVPTVSLQQQFIPIHSSVTDAI
jgi:hypothetical protein